MNANLVTGLRYPYGIVASGEDLYVANTYPYGHIGEYTTDGAPVNADLFQTGSLPDNYVHGLAMFGGNLFTLDSAAGTIGEYDASTGTYNADLVTGLGQGWGNEYGHRGRRANPPPLASCSPVLSACSPTLGDGGDEFSPPGSRLRCHRYRRHRLVRSARLERPSRRRPRRCRRPNNKTQSERGGRWPWKLPLKSPRPG